MADKNSIEIDGLKLNASRRVNDYSNSKLDNPYDSQFIFYPNYSINNYIEDRSNWKKQITSISGEMGFFYFKIFFNFQTSYGLLGGVINHDEEINTAHKYLSSIENLKMYKSLKISDRKLSLEKFVKTLAFISTSAPWFFKEVTGINNIKGAYTSDFNKDKEIEIKCSEEAIDMRLGTLFDLYKYASFDNINCKEILPANLRKFEMSILFFNVPLKLYQRSIKNNVTGDKVDGKQLNFNDDVSNIMSFKMYTFQNCEFDPDSLNEIQDGINNGESFKLGTNTIKIKYDRVYEHRMNEWEQYLFGSTGFIYSKKDDINKSTNDKNDLRIKMLSNLDEQPRGYAQLEIESEKFADLFIRQLSPKFTLGNIYGTFTNTHSQYFNKKLDNISDGTIEGGNIYNYSLGRDGIDSNRNNTPYLDKKLERIKNGTISGNIYDYNLGREGEDVNRHNTKYLDTKLNNLKTNEIKEDLNIKNLGSKNEYKELEPASELSIEQYGTPDSFKLSWDSQAIQNSNNMYEVDGIQSTQKTWLGRLAESTWKRTKNEFGF